MLDSDVLIEILDRKSSKGDEAVKKIIESGEKIATTAISLHEVLYGLLKYAKPIKEILLIPVLNYTKEDAMLASKIELETEGTGKAISRTDSMIAAIVIDNGGKLYTFNSKHFKRIKDLGMVLLE